MNPTKEQMLEWLDTAIGEYDYATEERTREAIRSLIESSGEKARIPSVAGELIDREYAEDDMPEPAPSPGPESGIANAKNIGVPDEQDLPAALRDGDIRPQDYNAPLSTPGVISPAEVEEAMGVVNFKVACVYEMAKLKECHCWGCEHNRQVDAAIAVMRAALTKP